MSKIGRPLAILELMIEMGFFEEGEALPEQEEFSARYDVFVQELNEIYKELEEHHEKLDKRVNLNKICSEILKRQLKDSRGRQKKRRIEKAKEREARIKAWKEHLKNELITVGSRYSRLLNDTTSDETKLHQQGLPVLHTWDDITKLLGIELKKLRWLVYYEPVSFYEHYIEYRVPKRSGGYRTISAPMPQLKHVQRTILDEILNKIPLHDAAHGFAIGRSIRTNAAMHENPFMIINVDIRDFFPSITYQRVLGLFRALGYSGQISTLLALLTTYTPRRKMKWRGKDVYVSKGQRILPQGAPTSPAITNLICRRLDVRFSKLAEKENVTYSRYADDITFSIPQPEIPDNQMDHINEKIGKILGMTHKTLQAEGFEVHKKKTRVLKPRHRQEITGLVVNNGGTRIPRPWLRRLRAILHNMKKHGIKSQDRDEIGLKRFYCKISGMCSYVNMVDSEKGKALWNEWNEIKKLHADELKELQLDSS